MANFDFGSQTHVKYTFGWLRIPYAVRRIGSELFPDELTAFNIRKQTSLRHITDRKNSSCNFNR